MRYVKSASEAIKIIHDNGKYCCFEIEGEMVDVYDSGRYLIAEGDNLRVAHPYDKDFSIDENLEYLYTKYIETQGVENG